MQTTAASESTCGPRDADVDGKSAAAAAAIAADESAADAASSAVACCSSDGGSVKERLKKLEGNNRYHRPSQPFVSGTYLRPKPQSPPQAASSTCSTDKKVSELESILRHREQLIQSLEESVSRKESDLSFVLKEKFKLSREVHAWRSTSQSSPQCIQQQRKDIINSISERNTKTVSISPSCMSSKALSSPSCSPWEDMEWRETADVNLPSNDNEQKNEDDMHGNPRDQHSLICIKEESGNQERTIACTQKEDVKCMQRQQEVKKCKKGGTCALNEGKCKERKSIASDSSEGQNKGNGEMMKEAVLSLQRDNSNYRMQGLVDSNVSSPSISPFKPLLNDAAEYLKSNRWRLSKRRIGNTSDNIDANEKPVVNTNGNENIRGNGSMNGSGNVNENGNMNGNKNINGNGNKSGNENTGGNEDGSIGENTHGDGNTNENTSGNENMNGNKNISGSGNMNGNEDISGSIYINMKGGVNMNKGLNMNRITDMKRNEERKGNMNTREGLLEEGYEMKDRLCNEIANELKRSAAGITDLMQEGNTSDREEDVIQSNLDIPYGSKFQAELFFKALLVQTQARIDAEAEASDFIVMHDELSSKIDSLHNAFEEICQELDAVRKENKALMQKASLNSQKIADDEERAHTKASPDHAGRGDLRSPALHALRESPSNLGDVDAHRQSSTGPTSTCQRSELQHVSSNMKLDEFTVEQMKAAVCNMEQKLHEAAVDRRILEESKSKSDAALEAMQQELKECQTQLALMEQRCKLVQDMDNRTWRMLETLVLTRGLHEDGSSKDQPAKLCGST